MNINLYLLIHLLTINICSHALSINKIYLSEETGAKCNDGNPSGYFYYESPVQSTKFMIHFYPTGWCSHEQFDNDFLGSCYQRTFNERGSIQSYPSSRTRDQKEGIFNWNKEGNPHFYDFNSVVIASCDGAYNQGYSKEPYVYKNKNIWFRGENNTIAALNDANKKYKLFQATELIIAGCSSAGLTAIIWANYIQNLFPSTTKVWVYCDSGFYVDYKYLPTGQSRLRNQMIQMMSYANNDIDPINKECVEDNPDEKWKCLLAEYAVQYVKAPVFVSQFEYDWWHITYILGEQCGNQYRLSNGKCNPCNNKVVDNIEKWREYVVNRIDSILKEKSNDNYYWRVPCFYHCMYYDDHVWNNPNDYSFNSQSLSEALYHWMLKTK